MTTIPSNSAASYESGFRFSGSVSGKFLFTALAAILLAQTSLAADVAGTARLIRERRGHTATAIGGGKILVAGGLNLSGALADVETFDAASGTFTVAARLLTPRAEHTATRLADGRVFLIGGRATEALTATEFFDPTRNVFSSGPSLNSSRFGHTATLLPDGRVVVIGGNAAGTAEIFDPRVGTFSALPCHLSEPRSFHAAIRLRDGSILIAGGISTEGKTLRSAEVLHPDTLECEHIGNMFAARARFALRMLPDGKVQAIGGDAERTMELFNPLGYFSSPAHLAGTASSESAALRNPGRLAIIGPSARPISDGTTAIVGGRELIRPVQSLLDRVDYSVTEVPEAGIAVATGGVSSTGRYQQTAVLFDASTATVTTDQTDYAPGQTVTITGAGWLPGETVSLNIHRDTNDPPDTVLTAVADAGGNITNSDYVCQEFDRGVVFLLTASGQTSGYTAQTSFTDGNVKWTIAPNGTAAVVETLYSAATNCTGAVKSGYPKTVDNDKDNVGVGSNESLRLDAPTNQSPPNAFRVFVAWSTTNSATFTVIAGTGGKSICVPDQTGNPDLVATYSCVAEDDGNPCTVDTCNQTTGTTTHTPGNAGAVCRADAGQCDVAETCTGSSAVCPADAFEPTATLCTGASQGGECNDDPADHCTGTSNTCVDVFKAATTTCGDAGTQCTNQDFCSGTSAACTDNGFKADTTSCTGTSQGGECNDDPADHCTGTSNTCVDVFKAATTTCGDAGTQCTNQDFCSGTSAACTDNGFKADTTSCTGTSQGGECNDDPADHCTGTSNTCVDVFKAATTTCGDAGTQCTNQDFCSGTSAACTDNGFKADTTSCTGTSQGGECNDDPADHCTGTSNACVDVFKANTTTCGDAGTECTNQDLCNGTGSCTDNGFKSPGTSCGSASDTECTNPDTCSGSGTCQANDESATTTCGDAGTECTNQDLCNGTGSCTDNGFKSPGTSCGSASDTECTNPDTCSGSGTCQANDEPATTTCGDAGTECTNQDLCNGTGSCTDNGFKSPGTSCGSASDTECTNPDTCSGSGTCQANDESATTTCGDAGTECTNQDLCNGTGSCTDNGFKSPGTSCGSASDTECTNPDTCSGSGTCQANDEPATTTCGDAGTECTNQDLCNGTGSCTDNGFKSSTTSCTGTSQGGACDATDHCSGTSSACVDQYQAAGYVCQVDAGQCDVAETCSGSSGACPAEGFEPNGTGCVDTNVCTIQDTCQAGICTSGSPNPACIGGICPGNAPPVVGPVSGPSGSPAPIGSSVASVSANFTDLNVTDTHTCVILWDDGSQSNGTVVESNGSGTCTGGPHTYTSPGVYTITVRVTDACPSSGESYFQYVVIFDPSAGFVTGGGWINQPAGGYPNLPGNKATFGFVSKYKKGNFTPDGETEFQFKAGDINFHSSGYDYGSLVISGGKKATYRGDGTVNGEAGYRFVLIAIDGDAPPSSGPDRFRIKITRGSSVIYDNRPGSSEDPDLSATDALGGGSIVIHK